METHLKDKKISTDSGAYVIPLQELGMNDVEQVGGKNASLGEMISNLTNLGVRVPGGFSTTAVAYRDFLSQQSEGETLRERISAALAPLNVDDIKQLVATGKSIRAWIRATPLPERLTTEIAKAWQQMDAAHEGELSVAVRSSATAEDLPDASFAGQQETFLNIRGIEQLNIALHDVFASLYNDRAISYRVHQGYAHDDVALAVGVQQMVRSDLACSGVMFTLDTESGFRDVVLITASYGLGETIVQGAVNPDEFYVYKPALRAGKRSILRKNLGSKAIKMIFADGDVPGKTVTTVDVDAEESARFSLTDAETETLSRYALIVEDHYARPMDIEWGKDGQDGQIYLLQARPETVQSQTSQVIQRYTLKNHSRILTTGRSVGQLIGSGPVKIIRDPDDMHRVQNGDVLVADMTDPDWEPVMKRAAAIVTNRGGRTCHAAIIARELGVPAVVGCGDATETLVDGDIVTVSCAEGDTGHIYEGRLDFDQQQIEVNNLPDVAVKIMMNVGNPDRAFDFANIPNHGVGLARLEFIINRMIGVHPKALLEFDELRPDLKNMIRTQMAGYDDPVEFFVGRLSEGISSIAAAFSPKPVIVRMSDFKSNEYANLLGGQQYEPQEENPMLGFRGASRYRAESFNDCFEMECRALKRVRDDMGLTNVQIMLPFVRTVGEAKTVTQLLASHGLKRGENGLKLIMMCELPSNALLAEQFLEYFDGMSIGSNDMTQLTLGLDRDSALIADLFDERDPAVLSLLKMAIEACKKQGKYIGICGQGPSDHPDFARWLLEQGIDSLSLNPDTVLETWLYLAGEKV